MPSPGQAPFEWLLFSHLLLGLLVPGLQQSKIENEIQIFPSHDIHCDMINYTNTITAIPHKI